MVQLLTGTFYKNSLRYKRFHKASGKHYLSVRWLLLPVLAVSAIGCAVVEPKTETQISYLGFIDQYELQAPSTEYDRDAWVLERSEVSYQRLLSTLPAMPLPAVSMVNAENNSETELRTLEFEWVKQLVASGNEQARVHLALLTWMASGHQQSNTDENSRNALAVLSGLKQKDAFADYLTGAILLPSQPVKAVQSLSLSAEQGYAPAQAALARLYLGHDGVPRNDQQAYRHFTRLAENHNAEAYLQNQARSYLAVMDFYGVGTSVSTQKSWGELGSAELSAALLYLKGVMQAEGLGVAAHPEKASAILEQSIALGSASAANELAWQKLVGPQAVRDVAEAYSFLERADALGSDAATFNLGLEHLRGNSSPSSIQQAERWLTRAAGAGHEQSARMLAYLQLEDQKWYDVSAGIGHRETRMIRRTLTDLAKGGDSWSSYALGLLSLRGQGGAVDIQQGYAWLNVAVALGYRAAAPLRDAAGVQMTRPQLERAQALSQSLFDGIEKNKPSNKPNNIVTLLEGAQS